MRMPPRFLGILSLSILGSCFLAHGQRVIEIVDTVDELVTRNPLNKNTVYMTRGRSSVGDGGGGQFDWIANSTVSTNRGTKFKAASSSTGRFIRIYSGPLDVRWFGAFPGDGVVDSTAISDAIASLPDNGGDVRFPAGEYTINTRILFTVNKDINLVGESTFNSLQTVSPGTVIKLANGANSHMLVKEAGGRVNISGIVFDGNRANQTATNLYGIWLKGLPDPTERVTIDNCIIQSISGTGFQVDNRETHTYRIHIRDCLAHGLVDTASSDCTYNNILVGFNYGWGVILDGVEGTGSNSKYFNYGNIFRNGLGGVLLTNASNNNFVGVKMDANNREGLLITGTSLRNVFDGCSPVVNNYPKWVDQTDSPIASGTYSNVKLSGTNVYDVVFNKCRFYEYESLLHQQYNYRPKYLFEDARTVFYTDFARVHLDGSMFTEASTFWTVNYANQSIRTNASGVWLLDGVSQHKNNEYFDVLRVAKSRVQDQLEGAVGLQINAHYNSGWYYRSNGPAFYLGARYDDPIWRFFYAPTANADDPLTWVQAMAINSTNGFVAIKTTPTLLPFEVNGKAKFEALEVTDGLAVNALFESSAWSRRIDGYAYQIQGQSSHSNLVINVADTNLAGTSITWLPTVRIWQDGTVQLTTRLDTPEIKLGGVARTTWPSFDEIDELSVGTIIVTNGITAETVEVDTEAYGAGWAGDNTVPTKDAIDDWALIFDTDRDGKVNVLDIGAGIPKTDANGVISLATAGTDYTTPSSTESFTNKTLDASATGNVLKQKKYLTFGAVDTVDGTGTVIQTTASEQRLRANFSHEVDEASNWGLWNAVSVPEDLDTTVDLKIERFKFISGGADTGTQRYIISMYSAGDSVVDYSTTINAVNLDFAGDPSGEAGDYQTISNVTLTSWRTSLTPGNGWFIKVARDGDAAQDSSTQDSWLAGFVISYTSTQ